MCTLNRWIGRALMVCLIAAAAAIAPAQDAAGAKPAVGAQVSPAEVYGKLLSALEKEIVSAAEAMPEDKYGFVPATGEYKGVNNFGQQVKHVAQANGYLFHDPGKPMPDTKAKFAALKTKAEMVQALKDSFAQAHAFVDAMTAGNAFVMTARGTRAGMATMGLAHMMDHYGQMVEYLRLNGIVPPASRH